MAKNIPNAFQLTAKAVKSLNKRAKIYLFKSKGDDPSYELAAFVTPAPQPGALQKVLNKILGKKVEIVALPPSVQTIITKMESVMQACHEPLRAVWDAPAREGSHLVAAA